MAHKYTFRIHTQTGPRTRITAHAVATEEQMEYRLLDCLNHQQICRIWKYDNYTHWLWGAVEPHPDNPSQLITWNETRFKPAHS